jgi:SAM-dependent methyltransferase
MKTTSNVFNSYSDYYDLLYRDKDYYGETDYIQTLLTRQNVTHGNILEFGSGTGKHGRLLALRGHEVHGVELSPGMVEKSEASEGFTCQQGDICTIQLERVFDAVVSLFHVISYQVTNEDLRAVFIRANEHLKPGGVFIFDCWYSPAVYSQRPVVRVKRMKDEKVSITRIAEPIIYPNENRVDVNYTIFARELKSGVVQIISETHSMRHFSLPEIDILAKESGFERIAEEEFLSGKTPGEDTWGVCVTLQKI